MKKILFLINTLDGGGAEKVLVDLVNNLNEEKYDITVQTIIDEGCYIDQLNSNIKYKTIIKTKNRFFKKLLTKIFTKILPCKWIYKWYIKNEYDIEVAFLEGLPTKILSVSSKNKVTWLHSDLVSYPNSSICYGGEKKEKKAYEKYNNIVCVSESVKEKLVSKYNLDGTNIRVIYNVLDDEAILQKSSQIVKLDLIDAPTIVSVGRLCHQKGYDILLRIHKRLIEHGLQHNLIILGDGPDRIILEKYIADNNLQKTVKLLGFQSNPYKYIKMADLFVCSSRAEGFSMVISESVIIGVPVVSVDASGIREPFEAPRCSIIVENSENALYEELKSILSDSLKIDALKLDVNSRKNYLTKSYLIKKVEDFFDGI